MRVYLLDWSVRTHGRTEDFVDRRKPVLVNNILSSLKGKNPSSSTVASTEPWCGNSLIDLRNLIDALVLSSERDRVTVVVEGRKEACLLLLCRQCGAERPITIFSPVVVVPIPQVFCLNQASLGCQVVSTNKYKRPNLHLVPTATPGGVMYVCVSKR